MTFGLPGYFEVWNEETDDDAPAFAVMQVVGIKQLKDTDGNLKRYAVQVAKPDADVRERPWVINGPIELKSESSGYATSCIDFAWGLYDSAETPTAWEIWGPTKDSWKLTEGHPGFVVLGEIDATNTKMLVRRSHGLKLLGKTAASHAKGASGTIDVWAGKTMGSESVVTGVTVSAWNRFAALDSGKWVHAEVVGADWELSAAEC